MQIDKTYEQTNYFGLALKYPSEDSFVIEGTALSSSMKTLEDLLEDMSMNPSYDKCEKKIFHFQLRGEVESPQQKE